MANNRIQVKRTSVSGRTANVTNVTNSQYIAAGELALNMPDGILYSSNGSALITVGANLVNQNITGNLTVKAIIANGSIGSAGETLTSNGSAIYWATGAGSGTVTQVNTGNGMTGGPITTTGTVSILANTGIVANATGTYVNATYIGTLTANNTSFVGSVSAANVVSNAQLSGNLANYQTTAGLAGNVATLTANNATNLNGQPASYYTNATNITTGTLPYAQIPANIVNTTANFTIAGNTTFSGFINSTSTIATSVGANGIQLRNATSNWIGWNTNGAAAPTTTTSSAGTKLLLYPSVSATSVDYAIGIESNHMWFSSWSSASAGFKWYANTTNFMISNTSGLYHTGTVNAASYSVGSSFTANSTVVNTPTVSANVLLITASNDSITYTTSVDGWYFDNSFSVSAQETEPRDIDFSSNGSLMYILGNTGDDITVYTLSSAWNVATASVTTTFSIAGQETTARGLYFKPDGTKFYIIGATNDTVYQYALSSAWDVSTASYESKSFSAAAQEGTPNAIYFSSDGTKMYIIGDTNDTVYQYTLSVAWDVSTASYASKSLSVTAYDTVPEGLSFNSDGTKLWVLGATYARLVEYNLSVAWDISTATFSNFVTLSNLGIYDVTGASGLYVNQSQGYAYITDYGNDRVFQLKTSIPSTKLVGTKWVVEPDFFVKNDLIVDKNSRFNQNIRVVGTATAGAVTASSFTVTGAATFSTAAGAISIGTSQTTGAITAGGTTQTGAIQIGRSTANQTIAIANGATTSGNVKTISIGTFGAAGSQTNITIGSSLSNTLITVDANNTLFSGNVVANNANTTFDLNVGRNLTVAGNLTITGNVTIVGANTLEIVDNFIYLNSNNTTQNEDIGIAGNYNDGTYAHTGIFRDATDGYWKIFDGYTPEPDASVNIDTANSTFNIAGFWTNNIRLGNSTVYGTINSTSYSGTSNNTSFVGTVSAANVVSNAQLSGNLANYQTTAGLAANVATLTANNANFVKANSGITSNSSGVFVTQGTGTVVNATGVHVNATYIGTLSANNTTYVNGKTEGNLNVNSAATPAFSGDAVTKADITTRTETGFYQYSLANTVLGWPVNSNSWQHLISAAHSNDGNYYAMQIAATFYDQDWYFRNTNGSGTTGWSKVWHNNNDGAGSGLDADLLDGNQASAFQTTAGLSANVATLTSNNASFLGGVAAANYLRSDAADIFSGTYINPSSNTILLGNSTQRWVLSGNTGNFSGDVTALNFNSTSDISLKINVKNIENPIEKINSIRGVNFNWKKDNTYTMGFIAQEIERVLPELVSIQQDGTKTVSYGNITALLVEALKEQQKQIQSLKDKIEELKNINNNKQI